MDFGCLSRVGNRSIRNGFCLTLFTRWSGFRRCKLRVDRVFRIWGFGESEFFQKGLIGFRYVGLRYLGVTSLTLLLWAGFFANKVLATVLFSAGLLSGALYTLSMMFQVRPPVPPRPHCM